MGVRAWVKKLQRAFPEIKVGYLTVGDARVVNVVRGDVQIRAHFTEPNEWMLTGPGMSIHCWQEERAFINAVQCLALPDENADLIAHTQIGDQMWREFNEGIVSEGMMDLREKMVKEMVVRENDSLFEYRPVAVDPETMARIVIQCEPGWFKLIGDCLDKIRVETQAMEWKDHRLKITCVKEKFAGLRIYFDIRNKDGQSHWLFNDIPRDVLLVLTDSVQNHISVAETLARNTCEVCGKAGKMHGKAGEHIQTLCDEHALLLKRSESPPELQMMFGPQAVDGLQFLKLIQQEEKENDELRIRRDGGSQDRPASPA